MKEDINGDIESTALNDYMTMSQGNMQTTTTVPLRRGRVSNEDIAEDTLSSAGFASLHAIPALLPVIGCLIRLGVLGQVSGPQQAQHQVKFSRKGGRIHGDLTQQVVVAPFQFILYHTIFTIL